jgi:hypothetical protein
VLFPQASKQGPGEGEKNFARLKTSHANKQKTKKAIPGERTKGLQAPLPQLKASMHARRNKKSPTVNNEIHIFV